ncbi:hypothetical protein QJS10_CPB18g00338 [Acorus calamus]|uniref:Protein HEADING DATE REPRESSOR 1 n=1 Tax=Acorus calamus TaxID=4465 RepID=A0AAV9CPS8_ACOCL|nr:hypothetical protein QJS10_CPB18g00338 [Acorus calamus]
MFKQSQSTSVHHHGLLNHNQSPGLLVNREQQPKTYPPNPNQQRKSTSHLQSRLLSPNHCKSTSDIQNLMTSNWLGASAGYATTISYSRRGVPRATTPTTPRWWPSCRVRTPITPTAWKRSLPTKCHPTRPAYPAGYPKAFPNRHRPNKRSLDKMMEDNLETANKPAGPPVKEEESTATTENPTESKPELSDRRRALFEPLEPIQNSTGHRLTAEELLPPPDFDTASYPKGWLVGKKRKLVNVDVVESMRRIAVQEMNRKKSELEMSLSQDREIDGLNEQLEEDARCLEHLQIQLLGERSKRADVERQNLMLQNQINMLMNMLQETDGDVEDDPPADDHDS